MRVSRILFLAVVALFMIAPSADAADIVTLFKARLDNSGVISSGVPASTDTATGAALFTLTQPMGDPASTTLEYEIRLKHLDLSGFITPGINSDDVTAIHLHDVTRLPDGSPNPDTDTVGTLHVLNIFGAPRGGDDNDDMMFDVVAGFVTGNWENTDANPGVTPAPTVEVTSVLTELFGEDLWVMVHDTGFPSGAIGGFIVQVPEPSSLSLFAVGCFAAVVCLGRNRKKSIQAAGRVEP